MRRQLLESLVPTFLGGLLGIALAFADIMDIPLLAGRAFGSADRLGGQAVAVVGSQLQGPSRDFSHFTTMTFASPFETNIRRGFDHPEQLIGGILGRSVAPIMIMRYH